METLKTEIKKLVEEQKFYKNQRKTVNLIGERKISHSEAQWKHSVNRERLRIMYLALGILKDKDLSIIDSKFTELHPNSHCRYLKEEATKLAEKHGTEKIVCAN